MMDPHASGIQGVLVRSGVGIADERGESFLLVVLRGCVRGDLSECVPEGGVYVVDGGLEVGFGVGEFRKELAECVVAGVSEDGWGH